MTRSHGMSPAPNRRSTGCPLEAASSRAPRLLFLSQPTRIVACGCLLALLLSAGCNRPVELAYSSTEELKELPASHQTQIGEHLRRFFGTPQNPLLAMPTEDEEAEGGLTNLVDKDRLKHGAAVFRQRCAGCHGITGDGAGEAAPFLQPKPRDYRRGVYKFTSTPYGSKPNRKDLVRIIRRGAKGTSMPAFPFISDEDVNDLVDYVKSLSYRGELESAMVRVAEDDYDEDEEIEAEDYSRAYQRIHRNWETAEYETVLPVTAEPKYDDESILKGRQAFLDRACSKCHGQDAKGQMEWLSAQFIAEQESKPAGEKEQINFDAWGHAAPAADLTAGMLHGGRRPIDVYRRVYTGINGTPMPAFGQALSAEPETIWNIVHYVISVIENRHVEGLDQLKPKPLPNATDSENPEATSTDTPEPTSTDTPEPTSTDTPELKDDKPEPKADDKPEPKADNKPEPKADDKPEPKADDKPEPKADDKPEPKADDKPEPKADDKPEPK
ncbi:MAG: c-type cytochrome, partial [Planctomycetales bacterium]|nr:c-type cytochrome [Planctomycetales bacterium]